METPKSEICFYQNLGKLFYAIAFSDKVVHKKEYETLKKLVETEWKGLDGYVDAFHTDAAYQIEIVIDWLKDVHLDCKICFDDFKYFKKQHESLFTKKRKQLIWNTSNLIANSFAGRNKSETIILAKLKMVLEK